MKKLFVVLVVVCLSFTSFNSYARYHGADDKPCLEDDPTKFNDNIEQMRQWVISTEDARKNQSHVRYVDHIYEVEYQGKTIKCYQKGNTTNCE